MNFLMENIGNIFVGLCALIVLSNGFGGADESGDADDGWVHSSQNQCSPNYQGD